ncbi:hypothetical protein PybrP1_013177 [[Pythium] brassicae (nom. inval.)]|nr:hypothetical protein PybrP1_013177 [[Pythium] brassicae (nom. inval.)]
MTRCPTTHKALLLLVVLSTIASRCNVAAAAPATSCATFGECCDVCGEDSIRCARGPCSASFITKGFFSISLPTDSVGFWDVLFSFYGMVPYLAPIALALELLLRRRSWLRVFAFLFIPIVAAINALVLVTSLGDCAECARPCGACVASKGMPSGHATNAIGLCLWVLLETALGVGRVASARKKALVALGALALLVPVPYSRVYLGDHTPLQVGIGSADGVAFALAYFAFLRCVVAKRLARASQWLARGRFPITVVNDFSVTKDASPSRPDETLVATESASHQSQMYVNVPVTPV